MHDLMAAGFITPPSIHYVRSHGPAPRIRWEEHRLEASCTALVQVFQLLCACAQASCLRSITFNLWLVCDQWAPDPGTPTSIVLQQINSTVHLVFLPDSFITRLDQGCNVSSSASLLTPCDWMSV